MTTTHNEYNADGQRCWTATGTGGSCTASPTGPEAAYGWDAFGNLCWIDTTGTTGSGCGGGPTTGYTYTYNADGLRMKTAPTGGGSNTFAWDTITSSATPRILTDGTNAYIYGAPTLGAGTPPIEQVALSGGATSLLNGDPRGTTELFSTLGILQVAYDYPDAYGTNTSTTTYVGGKTTPFQYKGAYVDPTGLVYLDHRYYDPTTAQLLSIDPLVSVTLQPYSYAASDPINLNDPTGLCDCVNRLALLDTEVSDIGELFALASLTVAVVGLIGGLGVGLLPVTVEALQSAAVSLAGASAFATGVAAPIEYANSQSAGGNVQTTVNTLTAALGGLPTGSTAAHINNMGGAESTATGIKGLKNNPCG
jgi:RHS repeat-associated protein